MRLGGVLAMETPSSRGLVSWLLHRPGVGIATYAMESVVLTTRHFGLLVFFRVHSSTEKQFYSLSRKGYYPGHGAFNDLRFSPFEVGGSCGFSEPLKLVQLVQAWYSAILSTNTWRSIKKRRMYQEKFTSKDYNEAFSFVEYLCYLCSFVYRSFVLCRLNQ